MKLPFDHWELVIGLEIHTQLNTKSKLFSSAPNHFGDDPNTNITAVCTGQPGTLPVLNKEAVRKAVQFGSAIKGKIALSSRFDRKSYFYPDVTRNFQITQFDHPIVTSGTITADVEGVSKTFAIHRAHLEDDAGMLKHFTSFAGVDYNRAGAPLVEIVSEPCMHSAKEASAYAQAVRTLLIYLDVSDANMEEGNFRMDVNISIRPKGEKTLRPRVEIKNMNSFHFLEQAVQSEFERQLHLYLNHPHTPPLELIPPGTYRWDVEKNQTVLMRRKESADDYRYFPEPDLPPVILTQAYVDQIASSLPELPHDRYHRYTSSLGFSPYNASLLINNKPLSDYFEEALKLCSNARTLCNWITVEFTGLCAKTGKSLLDSNIPARHIAKLVELIEKNTITSKIAKAVAEDMIASPGQDPELIVKNNPNYQPLDNAAELERLVEQTLRDNPQSVADFKAGNHRAFGALVGHVMKLTSGKANPQLVNELLKKKM
jgi:aspartyl-tRNA(Asn)/glutamyl-tRNA(Gln) amidotransferase subunit B